MPNQLVQCNERKTLKNIETKTPIENSLTLLDEILANQSKILAPSKYLKINKDGTITETTDLKTYLEKKEKKVN